jgi:phosphatidylinositol alpha-1,6-mannosyltransferase
MPDALMITSSFLPGRGGIESYLAELCALLAPRVAVMAPGRRDGKPLPHDLPYETVAGPGHMLRPSASLAHSVATAAADFGTDRILFGTPWPLGLLGPQLTRLGLRYASLAFGSELFVPTAIPLLRRRLTRLLAGADLLLPMSDATETRLRSLLERANGASPVIEVMRARVDLERFHPSVDTGDVRDFLGLEQNARIVLCFGRLVKRKGVHRLIAVMEELVATHPTAVLVVAGSGPQEARLKRQAQSQRAPVVFTGRMAEQLTPALYAAADVFALPVADRWFGLDTEGLGIVLLEAAACGTPCVTGRSGGTVEAVVQGETGFIIDATSRVELVAALNRLLDSPEEGARMGRSAREFVTQRYPSGQVPEALLRWLS